MNNDAMNILDVPMIQPNDADAETIGDYLRELLLTLWIENEGFSGKRPFGNSSWKWEVHKSLIKAGLIEATYFDKEDDEEPEIRDYDKSRADLLILTAIKMMR